MDYAYELQKGTFFLSDNCTIPITKKPLEYLKMIYLDCVSYHAPAARSAIKTVGPGPMIFATDAPPLDVLKERDIALIEKTGLPAEDKENICFGNAKKLSKMN